MRADTERMKTMPVDPWQVPLWDAINRYVVACGGDPAKHVYGNTARMNAVVEVNGVVRDAVGAADRGEAYVAPLRADTERTQ
jgi:hypothetical protein